MATSGIYTFSRNRDQLLRSALRKAGAFASGEDIDSDAIVDAAEELNGLIKHWQATGIQIWRTVEMMLFLQQGQTSYVLGTTSTDRAAESFVETALSADAANGASSVTVDSVASISSGYQIGVQLDDGSFHWTTVNGAPVGSSVTLTLALVDSAAEGNRVITYASNAVRPLKFLSARLYNFDTELETPLDEMDRIEYQELPNKTTGATVNSFYYNRRGGAVETGLLYVWPKPTDVSTAIKATVARPIQDFTAAGDNADLPQEWVNAIVWNLAHPLAIEYDAPQRKIDNIERLAARYLNEVSWNEEELVTYQLVPDRR